MDGEPAETGAGAGSPEEELWAEFDRRTSPPRTGIHTAAESWRTRTVTGALLTGIALGFKEALEPERRPAVVVQIPDDDGEREPGPLEVTLDPDDPRASRVVVRRWLLRP